MTAFVSNPPGRHTCGVWKPAGSQANSVEAYGVRNVRMKIEAEAAFSRIRMFVTQRGAYGSSGWKFAVGPTDTWALDSLANAFHPRKGAIVRNDLQDASNPIGFTRASWGGGGRVMRGIGNVNGAYAGADKSGRLYPSTDWPQPYQQSKTAQALGDVIVSDWVHCRSVPPAALPPSGLSRHFANIVVSAVGGAFPIERYDSQIRSAAAALGNYTAWAAGDRRQRLTYVRAYTGGDGVADFTVQPAVAGVPNGTIDESYPMVFFEFDYDVPVESFACWGDSNTEGYAWPFRAINRLSTPEKPVTGANFGMSTNRSCQYFTLADNIISTGAGFNHWLFPSHSTNDGTNTRFDVDRNMAQIAHRVQEAQRLGVRPWLWTHFLGVFGPPGTSGNDPEIMVFLDQIRKLCLATGAVLVDVAANWNRSTMLGSLRVS